MRILLRIQHRKSITQASGITKYLVYSRYFRIALNIVFCFICDVELLIWIIKYQLSKCWKWIFLSGALSFTSPKNYRRFVVVAVLLFARGRKMCNENSIYGRPKKCGKNHKISMERCEKLLFSLFVYFSFTTKVLAKGLTLVMPTMHSTHTCKIQFENNDNNDIHTGQIFRNSIKQSNKQSARAFTFCIISLLCSNCLS